jgi:hypothetical protein
LKGPVSVRLIIATAIVIAIYGSMLGLKAAIKPPEVIFPAWSTKDLPFQLGSWVGQKAELDPAIFEATEAALAEDRIYHDEFGHTLSLHMAMYSDPDAGILHCPTRCYGANGWKSLKESKESLGVGQTPEPLVYFVRWDHEIAGQCFIVYWYQMGDVMLFDQLGLGSARFAFRKESAWPPLVKVLIQGNDTSEEGRERLMDFAKKVYLWLNLPSHKTESAASPAQSHSPAQAARATESANASKSAKADWMPQSSAARIANASRFFYTTPRVKEQCSVEYVPFGRMRY